MDLESGKTAERDRWMILYMEGMNNLICEIRKKDVELEDVTDKLSFSPREIELCKYVCDCRRHVFGMLKEEKNVIKEKYSKLFCKSIGEKIAETREEKKISQEEFADKLNISIFELSRLEQCRMIDQSFGEEKKLDAEFLKKISGILGIPYSDLLLIGGYSYVDSCKDFYTDKGEAIDVYEILTEIYYADPSKIAKLKELLL